MAKPSDLTVDADLVRALATLLDETGLTEIEYAVGDRRIRVARDAAPVAVTAMPAVASASSSAVTAPAEQRGAVPSPMVGTVYLSPQPGAPPFITAGDTVREGQTLLIIEAMKVMNQILAPRAARVGAILVADGAPVEYGQALVVLD